MEVPPLSLYFHIPFCLSRCSYCDFVTYAAQANRIPAYIEAMCLEIQEVAHKLHSPPVVHTLYFGGGTPSLIPDSEYKKIFDVIHRNFSIQPGAEITLEANPGTTRVDALIALRNLGFNRLSLGMQTAQPEELALLRRIHTFKDVENLFVWARKAGFDNINLDIIYGIPGQSLTSWKASLFSALELVPQHLSLYALTLEQNVPLQQWITKGQALPQDEDMMADMYEWALDYLQENGYQQYEISNWARSDEKKGLRMCLHNLQYWRNLPYLGFGAGAHGYAAGVRTENVQRIGDYIRRCHAGKIFKYPASPAIRSITHINRWLEMQETMMVGLRLTEEGITLSGFSKRFNREIQDVFGEEILGLLENGLIEFTVDPVRIRLTRRARLLGNLVFMHFIGKKET